MKSNQLYFVYAISSSIKNYIYVGITQNLKDRLSRHNEGRESTTKPYRPFNLIYAEEVEERPRARSREKYFKSGIGKQKLKEIRDSGIVVDLPVGRQARSD